MNDHIKQLVIDFGKLLESSVVLVLPFFICLALIQLLARLAPKLKMLDLPNERKRHESETPLVGGVAIFIAVAISLVLLVLRPTSLLLISLTLVLVILGLLDDRYDLSAKFRLLIQIMIALAMVFVAGVRIDDLGNLFGMGPLTLSPAVATVLTVVFALGVINAINMIDGVDGLAGSILFVSFGTLAFVSVSNGQFNIAKALFICTGTLLAFLCYNMRLFIKRAEIFMGDAGSMALGFMLLWFLARLTQAPIDALSPVAAGWIFGVPLLDTVVVIARRIRARRSPLSAGRDHLHHNLLDGGLTVNQTVLTLTLLHSAMAIIGVWVNDHRTYEPYVFGLFVLLVIVDFLYRDKIIERLLTARPGISR